MQFLSDNTAPVAPAVLEAMIAANAVDKGYDGDALSQALDARLGALFGRPCAAIWLSTGTATNALALTLLCPPWGGVLCYEEAHVVTDEAGAPEFFTQGAQLMPVPGRGAKLTVAALEARIGRIRDDVHQIQPAAISISNATEYGLVYTPAEVAEIAAFARDHGLRLHMDGARFANAVAHLGCTAAQAAAGLDALSFGFTKNGAMNAELLVLFDPAQAPLARRLRKRAGHLLSKGRFIAAQVHAMLDDDRWLAHARSANAAAALLGQAAAGRLLYPVEANELFVRLSAIEAESLRAQGFGFYDWGEGGARFVTSWCQGTADVAPLADAIAALSGSALPQAGA